MNQLRHEELTGLDPEYDRFLQIRYALAFGAVCSLRLYALRCSIYVHGM
jgi:hypothetical protein